MDVHFTRRSDNGSIAEFVRPDGATMRLHSYDPRGLARPLAGAWSIYRADPCPPVAAAEDAVTELRQWGQKWAGLGAGEQLTLVWR